MKLHWSPASPYVRKVMVAAYETGLDGRIERVETSPWPPDSGYAKINPLGKVPALVTDAGQALFDSGVICEYLDSLHDGTKLFPPVGAARWRALRLHALAHGILDAAVLRVMERRRPGELQSAEEMVRQKEKVERALDALEEKAGALEGPITIGSVTAGCALGYLDFRFAGETWRDGRAKLTAWYEGFQARPSMTATAPRDPA
ncbi:MAG: glutathione S-transferase N-terminal domain-containing protein [Alphaproteobacteria bacterium]